jgi:Co/Zn/Cd efflux system component
LQIGYRGPTSSLTFGYRRIEVMTAVFNVALLFGAALFIAYEGWVRFNHPVAIQGMLGQVDVLSKQVRNLLLEKFNIDHPILQFETSAYQPTNLLCRLCDPES